MTENEYEIQRAAQIAKNRERLISLGIPQLTSELEAASKCQQPKQKQRAPRQKIQTVPRQALPRQAKDTAQARLVQCRRLEETSPRKLLKELKSLKRHTTQTSDMTLVPLDAEQSAITKWLAVFHSSEGLDGEAHQNAVAQALLAANLKPTSVQHLSSDDYLPLLQRACRPALPADDLLAELAFSRYKVVFQELHTKSEGGEARWHTYHVPPVCAACTF